MSISSSTLNSRLSYLILTWQLAPFGCLIDISNMFKTKHLIFLPKLAHTSSFSISLYCIIFYSLLRPKTLEPCLVSLNVFISDLSRNPVGSTLKMYPLSDHSLLAPLEPLSLRHLPLMWMTINPIQEVFLLLLLPCRRIFPTYHQVWCS